MNSSLIENVTKNLAKIDNDKNEIAVVDSTYVKDTILAFSEYMEKYNRDLINSDILFKLLNSGLDKMICIGVKESFFDDFNGSFKLLAGDLKKEKIDNEGTSSRAKSGGRTELVFNSMFGYKTIRTTPFGSDTLNYSCSDLSILDGYGGVKNIILTETNGTHLFNSGPRSRHTDEHLFVTINLRDWRTKGINVSEKLDNYDSAFVYMGVILKEVFEKYGNTCKVMDKKTFKSSMNLEIYKRMMDLDTYYSDYKNNLVSHLHFINVISGEPKLMSAIGCSLFDSVFSICKRYKLCLFDNVNLHILRYMKTLYFGRKTRNLLKEPIKFFRSQRNAGAKGHVSTGKVIYFKNIYTRYLSYKGKSYIDNEDDVITNFELNKGLCIGSGLMGLKDNILTNKRSQNRSNFEKTIYFFDMDNLSLVYNEKEYLRYLKRYQNEEVDVMNEWKDFPLRACFKDMQVKIKGVSYLIDNEMDILIKVIENILEERTDLNGDAKEILKSLPQMLCLTYILFILTSGNYQEFNKIKDKISQFFPNGGIGYNMSFVDYSEQIENLYEPKIITSRDVMFYSHNSCISNLSCLDIDKFNFFGLNNEKPKIAVIDCCSGNFSLEQESDVDDEDDVVEVPEETISEIEHTNELIVDKTESVKDESIKNESLKVEDIKSVMLSLLFADEPYTYNQVCSCINSVEIKKDLIRRIAEKKAEEVSNEFAMESFRQDANNYISNNIHSLEMLNDSIFISNLFVVLFKGKDFCANELIKYLETLDMEKLYAWYKSCF